jgi:hypothetical protein
VKDETMISYSSALYRLRHWLFQWNYCEQDGSIVFTVAGALHFLKYKEHTIVYFGQGRKGDVDFTVKAARKYVEASAEAVRV